MPTKRTSKGSSGPLEEFCRRANVRLRVLPTTNPEGCDEAENQLPPVVLGPGKHRWYQYSLRYLLIAMTVGSIVMSCYAWFQHAIVEPNRVSREIRASIRSLAAKRPPSVRKDQWEIAVEWTDNLTGNSLLWAEGDLDDLRRFQRKLEEKTKGDVDMTTIFWIWDRHAQLTPAGKRYQRFRQQMLDEMHWGQSVEIQDR